MIDNEALENILDTATDISVVAEVYSSDAEPDDEGFDPNEAIGCFAAVEGIAFRGRSYTKSVSSFGSLRRTITNEINNATVSFDNLDGAFSSFEFNYGFEGLILVIRLISRGLSEEETDSQVLFVGRCEQPDSGNKEGLQVTAKFVLGSVDQQIPRRTFSEEDREGRVASDPEFEGFLFMPQYGTTQYSVRERRGGLLGLFGFKKTVKKTLPYSSHSDLDADKPVQEVLGRSQVLGVHIGYIDVGTTLKVRTAFTEGPISGMSNIRSIDARMPLTLLATHLGNVGTANGPDDPSFVSPGLYSRTSFIRGTVSNSAIDVIDAAPEIAAVIHGRMMKVPNSSDVWEGNVYTDNASAHTRFLITDSRYGNLGEGWIDDDYFTGVYRFNAENLIIRGLSDFLFIEETT